jgi:glycosyltransferase involved in cell wall biosynthesis
MVVHAYYPYGETRVQRQAEALIAAGWDVDVICLRHAQDDRAADTVNGVRVHRLPVSRRSGRTSGREGLGSQLVEYVRFTVLAALAVMRLGARRRFRTVQVHNPPDFLVVAALVPKLLGARVILDLHDLMPEFLASRLVADLADPRVRIVAFSERVACRLADHVITVTEPWRAVVVRRARLRRAGTTVVLNVADDRYFVQEQRRSPAGHDGDLRLIYHGTLAHRYGVDLLVEAVARLRTTIPRIHLTIHGHGELTQRLYDLVDERGVREHVSFSRDFLPMAELPALIRSADLGVVPYRRDVFTDGILPTKLMEYAALGVPAVAVRTPAIEAYFGPDMVEYVESEDVDGLVERIQHLHDDPARLAALAEGIARFSALHNWSTEAKRYRSVVETLARRDAEP